MEALGRFAEMAALPERSIDLAEAVLQIGAAGDPGIAPSRWLTELDGYAAKLADLGALRHRLFAELGFRGDTRNYYDPENSFLHRVIARRLGIPITLSVLTIEIGRRVGIEVDGVGLPGHFIVSARLAGRRVFLDPFNGGATLTPERAEEVAARAVGRPVKLEDAHWAPCSKHQIVVRMLRNLKGIYAKRQAWDRALGVVDRLLVLDADSGVHQRDRGTVLVRLGRLHEGATEWERYLTHFPGAPDAEGFREELRRVRQQLGSRN